MKFRILRLRARIHCRINIPFQISNERAEHSFSKPKSTDESQPIEVTIATQEISTAATAVAGIGIDKRVEDSQCCAIAHLCACR